MAYELTNLGLIALAERKTSLAQLSFERSLGLLEKKLGPGRPEVALVKLNLAVALLADGKHQRGEVLLEESLRIQQQFYPGGSPELADCHYWLAELEARRHHRVQAEQHYREAIQIRERTAGVSDPNLETVLRAYAKLLKDTRRPEARSIEHRANEIAAMQKAIPSGR